MECRQFDKNVDDASSAVGIWGSISFRTEMIAEGLTGKEAKKKPESSDPTVWMTASSS